MFGIVGRVTEEVAISTEVPLERLEAQICEGAALLAALTLGKDVLRDQKRSAERSAGMGAPNPEAETR
jgi:hypothetical protein